MAELSELNSESREEISVFAYGDRIAPALGNTTELQLPNRDVTNAMTSRYFDFAAPTYRFLHRPTFESWLLRYHEQQISHQESLQPIRQAIVLMVLATACLYNLESADETNTPSSTSPDSRKAERNDSHLRMGETLYQAAQQKITGETGRPCLESVQARLATSLYQLNTSRLNQAWYTLGSTYQLALSTGIHRARVPSSGEPSKIVRECQRRCFWAVHMLDTYLSVMLGRPPYINDTYVDQRYPEIVDDNDLLSAGTITRSIPKDCIQAAPVMHANSSTSGSRGRAVAEAASTFPLGWYSSLEFGSDLSQTAHGAADRVCTRYHDNYKTTTLRSTDRASFDAATYREMLVRRQICPRLGT
jgi:hypothetical protein